MATRAFWTQLIETPKVIFRALGHSVTFLGHCDGLRFLGGFNIDMLVLDSKNYVIF